MSKVNNKIQNAIKLQKIGYILLFLILISFKNAFIETPTISFLVFLQPYNFITSVMSEPVYNKKFKEHKSVNPVDIEKEVLDFWKREKIFEKSISSREGAPAYVFYEGPPSANGMPGIHHVLSRTIKDIFCRYKTLKGFQVHRKGGWDTHGLPVELQVEKVLGITKKDIGNKISVEEYNTKCREEVMKFKDAWDDITQKMGYWVDLENPYITFDNDYIETLWYLLKELYKKDFLYKGLKIQPYSPAAGTGLSSAELNLPGCYKMVKDTTAVAQFKLASPFPKHLADIEGDVHILAWTTTPWTLPSNTALAMGKNIEYVLVKTINPYTHVPINAVLAKVLMSNFFNPEHEDKDFSTYQQDGKNIPYQVLASFKGAELAGLAYEQLLPFDANAKENIEGDAFKIILGDFVTTEDGTGIVHIAPSFGADDMKVAAENGIGSLTMVDKEGKFVDGIGPYSGRFVKDYKDEPNYVSVDVDIVIQLKKENKAFKVEKYEHTYPHCWRTDKPVLYYPLDSWFIKVTAVKDRMIELNKTINWKPASTGEGRFGMWLENLVDWNLSRSRFWGTPLPIWRTEDGEEEICIGSVAELRSEVLKSVDKGFMKAPLADDFDLHKPYVDQIILTSSRDLPMKRESDLIDVWFDSGAMPYAQIHYPFENKEQLHNVFPADFIAEGVDQTRGWFYTLHALSTMLFDSVAYKNVVSNGLVLDKNGNKMSKRLGNAADPFQTLGKYGADATRWYMISNSQPWDNLKFDLEGIEEVSRKLYGTLYNTYAFFSLYANIDQFSVKEEQIPLSDRPEIDRWVISLLNTLIKNVDAFYADYEPTKATREIQTFVNDHLSNWYVRLCRRRFWKGEYSKDKIVAYQTLYQCLETVARLMAPVAPFYSDYLYKCLHTELDAAASVHLGLFPEVDFAAIDEDLEKRMDIAQEISSMVLSLRKKQSIKVRQPLQRIMLPVVREGFVEQVEQVKELILNEVNVKEIEYVNDTSGVVKKRIKPNFKLLGKKLGSKMKHASDIIQQFSQDDIRELETVGNKELFIDGERYEIELAEVEIFSDDIEGWLVTSNNGITVALDIHFTDSLLNEGMARELVNRIQNERKDAGFFVTDNIQIFVEENESIKDALIEFKQYICGETLAKDLCMVSSLPKAKEMEINELMVRILIEKI